MTGVLAACCGVTVANVYLSQPLLTLIRTEFGISSSRVGLIPAAAQLGYAAGLLLFVPLGDTVRRRRLLGALTVGTVIGLVAAASAPGLWSLSTATFAMCALTVAPQLVIPLAAELAAPERRATVLALLQAGLLSGIFLSRVVGGQIGAHAGWRGTFLVAGGCTAVIGAITVAVLPREPTRAALPYGQLLGSLPGLIRGEPALRQACLLQGLAFGTFSVFWTALTFLLVDPPVGLNPATAAWIGLFGMVSVLTVPLVGRLVDRYTALPVVGGALALLLLAGGLFAVARVSGGMGSRILVVGLAVVVLNVGVQAGQVANQSRVLALDPARRNRLNTVYMLAVFLSGAAGTSLGSILYDVWGWDGVGVLGVVPPLIGLTCWWLARRSRPQVEQKPVGHQ